jgi:hypothetical protein
MLRRAALIRTDVSEELSASIIRATRIGELGTANVVLNLPAVVTLMMALSSSETSVHTRATRRNIPGDGILRVTESFLGKGAQRRRVEAGFSAPPTDILKMG